MNSNFEVITSEIEGLKEVTLVNRNTDDLISVIPQSGCRLNDAVLRKNNLQYPVIRKLKSPDFTSRDDLFNNVKLFPFSNRLEGGCYSFADKTYILDINYPEEVNAAHGFIYDKPFEFTGSIIEKSASLIFRFDYSGNIKGYPFPFSILITYTLTDEGEVICTTRIINNSDQSIPFNDGWHPYFSLGRDIDYLTLTLNAERLIKTNEYGIPDGSYETTGNSFSRLSLNNKKFDSIFLLRKQKKCITDLHSPEEGITLSVWQDAGDEGYRYVVLYTPPDRRFIAIEPMTSNVNAFNNKEHLIVLNPGSVWERSFGFKLK
jgi:aldose 1-epimerase